MMAKENLKKEKSSKLINMQYSWIVLIIFTFLNVFHVNAEETFNPKTEITDLRTLKGGKKVDAYETLGNKPTLLFFVASWCGPCAKFAPIFSEFHKKNAKHYDLVVVCRDKRRSSGTAFLRKNKIKEGFIVFPGDVEKKIVKTLNAAEVPKLIVIGSDGKVLERNAHFHFKSDMGFPDKWKK